MSTLAEAIAALPARVLAEKHRRGLSWRAVADETGLPHVTVWQGATGAREPGLATLRAFAEWLDR